MRCPGQIYAFGDFRLDPRRRALWSRTSGQMVQLPASAFDLLVQLVEQAGTVVCRQSLLSSIWPHATVVENSVNQAVAHIRRALGEDPAQPTYIETVSGRGYRFAGEVRTEGPADRDPETYQFYVAGWLALTRPGPGTLEAAQGYFEQAVARDPDFSLAMVCLAETHMLLGSHGIRPPQPSFAQAFAAVHAALKSDPLSAEAHAMLSQLVLAYDHDLARAASLMARALELDPACFIAHRFLGLQLGMQGRVEEALALLRRAQAIEPLAVHINGNIGMVYYFAGRFEEAIAQLEHTMRLDENWVVARSTLGRSYLCRGQFDRALELFERRDGVARGRIPDLAIAYALSGRIDDARRELARFSQRPEGEYIPPIHFVTIHAALGDHDAALDWVDRVIEERVNIGFLVWEPLLAGLREDPRVIQRLARTGLGPLLGNRELAHSG
ncbi:MAG TPA: winged helix-turn-helix domain-containing protein [Rhizomicrobium sp.]|nr:winged helix-turn-helix domain-containing protein [Rhizomicrobium sp.]